MILLALKVLLVLYVLICGLLYFFQEKLIFFPEKLSKDYKFPFLASFEEISIKTADQVNLHALLFKVPQPNGVIFYLHGNAGALNSWGEVADIYNQLGYDVFLLDYRGYGKSQGQISSQKQFYQDAQVAYDVVKKRYKEEAIVVLGYSIGTGAATKIAAENHPRLLILQAPYYSLTDMMRQFYPIIPAFVLKYKFETYKYITACKMPVLLFHGDQDEVIYYGSSVRLKKLLKPEDMLITLQGQSHNGMSDNPDYLAALSKVLSN